METKVNWRARSSKIAIALALMVSRSGIATQLPPTPVVTTPRVYVLDCGTIVNDRPETFGLTRDEAKSTILSDMCFLIVHPKGTVMYDTGLNDRIVGRPAYENILGHDAFLKFVTVRGQLADLGYDPKMINYLVLSHGTFDHSGNANLFAKSTWLVAKPEWNAMFNAAKPPTGYDDFAELKGAKTVYISDNYDIFGDGSVVIKQAFGHSPGHSIIQLRLKNTGYVLLVGDLYHYPQELTLNRIPEKEVNTGSAETRAKVQALAKRLGAQMWAAHDLGLFQRIHKEPAFYD